MWFNVPVNNFFSNVETEPPIPGYYQYFWGVNVPFLDLHIYISNGFVSSKIHGKRDDFNFDIVNFPFLDGDVPCRVIFSTY